MTAFKDAKWDKMPNRTYSDCPQCGHDGFVLEEGYCGCADNPDNECLCLYSDDKQAFTDWPVPEDVEIEVSGRQIEDWRERCRTHPAYTEAKAQEIAGHYGYGDCWPVIAASYLFPGEVRQAKS